MQTLSLIKTMTAEEAISDGCNLHSETFRVHVYLHDNIVILEEGHSGFSVTTHIGEVRNVPKKTAINFVLGSSNAKLEMN